MAAKLLIVDDEEHICSMLSRHFEYLGYDVTTADCAKKALAFLENAKADVVISDIMMPGMSGVEMLKIIRREYPMTRVIMITGYVTLENGLACLRYGADTCVFKPIEDVAELETAVARAVDYLNHWQSKLKMLRELKSQTIG
jgi:DNA-binding NtrC family response regulator